MPSEDFDEVEFRAVSRSRAFLSYDRNDYAQSPQLVEVLQVTATEAEDLAIANGRAAAALRKQCDIVRQELNTAKVAHERQQGSLRAEFRRLETVNSSLEEKLAEAYRQSAIAIIIAWLGTALVGLGINLITADKNESLGFLIILLGAATEASAFFVRRRGSRKPGGQT